MPDVAQNQSSPFQIPLDWVGMENVELPIKGFGGIPSSAKASLFVDIADPHAKGIHMSRLYLTLKEKLENNPITTKVLKETLNQFIDSHEGISQSARLVLNWDQLFERKALKSDNSGWKSYPMQVEVQYLNNEWLVAVQFSLFYSSTCPCSAALSRQLFQKAFAKEFHDDNINFERVHQWLGDNQVAAPHSQRSRADVWMKLDDTKDDYKIVSYIDAIEDTLKTPVQTAVKREDEQEFARLNGENLMFVEDALRKMKQCLNQHPEIKDFQIKASHIESLHAHDAVGFVSKG